mmetsp:Transcript_66840/g.195441  ORF Transcript_66840/g.195441 Transcript_66840/m.195441 type:complete len:84 (+) Transcript_66840:104-355(+)
MPAKDEPSSLAGWSAGAAPQARPPADGARTAGLDATSGAKATVLSRAMHAAAAAAARSLQQALKRGIASLEWVARVGAKVARA